MIIGPKYKICKRLGGGIFEKCQTQKFVLSESRLKKKRGRRPKAISDYGRQLLEKQKMRYLYGITEKQLSKYVALSTHLTSDPSNRLFQSLESRIDNVVYRLGLATTRRFARQIVSHGHVMINGRRTTIPSYKTKVGDVLSIRPNSREKGMFINLKEQLEDHSTPDWLSFDEKKFEGKIINQPKLSETDTIFDLQLVLEFYSR